MTLANKVAIPPSVQRDHLFISYAVEDGYLAEWLTLKLTSEGYKVWCDRIKLLGGESYPRDIDEAIKERSFRVLALISRNSVNKPNPVKERTLSHNISRERGIAFLIPLRVDGITSPELDWMSSDLTYIDFSDNWATGFSRLLEKLQSIDAPRPIADGKARVVNWTASLSAHSTREERVWTNLLEVRSLPQELHRIEITPTESIDWPADWIFYSESRSVFWSFANPNSLVDGFSPRVTSFDWQKEPESLPLPSHQIVSVLLRRHLRQYCLKRGMKQSHNRLYLYFPPGLLSGDRLRFQSYSGRSSFVNAVGERTFRLSGGKSEKSRYHLSPVFRPNLVQYERPMVQILLRLFLTDLDGVALDERQINRRRKRICKDWWNHQWLSRLIGVTFWLGEGGDFFNAAVDSSHQIIVSGRQTHITSPVGIDESRLGEIIVDEEGELVDDDFGELLDDDENFDD